VGSGGAVGSGGTTGSGGSGSGGTGGATPDVCDAIAAEYQAEMPAAKTCSLTVTVAQCQTAVSIALGCGMGCLTYVQDATALDDTLQKWNAKNCDSIARICPAIACISAQRGQCGLSGTSMAPLCQNGPIATD
jgi:hypothetical protein